MTQQGQILPRIGWGIAALVLLRILFSCAPIDRWKLFSQPEAAAILLPEKESVPVQSPVQTEPPAEHIVGSTEPSEAAPDPTEPTAKPLVPGQTQCFEEADTAFLEINYSANRKPDLETLLTQPLPWDLIQDEPTVLIFHTHGTEAFTPTEDLTYKEEGGEYRTTDENCNMVSVGEELTRLLKQAGINAIHDRTLYDAKDYLASYDTARAGLQETLKKYPTVKLVIDLHRDSAQREDGSQWATQSIVNGEKSAQVMLVVGTDSYYHHPNWEQNLSLALKLNAVMEKTHTGVTRPLDLRKQRFNQDLSAGALIAEIGSAGNTHREAMNAVSVLAEAIILLAQGSA